MKMKLLRELENKIKKKKKADKDGFGDRQVSTLARLKLQKQGLSSSNQLPITNTNTSFLKTEKVVPKEDQMTIDPYHI